MFAARGGFLAQPTSSGDPFWANVKMLITARSGTIVDASTVGAAITQNFTAPGASVVSTPVKYNPYAIFNTGGGRWSIAINAQRSCPGQFTFEWWWRSQGLTAGSTFEVPWMISPINQAAGNIVSQIGTTNSNRWSINNYGGTNRNFTTLNAYDQIYHHVAFTRDASSVIRFFYDGVLFGTTVTNSVTHGFNNLIIFGGAGAADNRSQGYWDDLRLTVGVCRYTTTFTPPVGPFPIG